MKPMMVKADEADIGRKIKRQHLVMRNAHNAGAKHTGHDTARRDPRNGLGAIGGRHQFHRGEAIHLQAGHSVTQNQPAQAH
jgi:hypothetical protein